MVKDWGHNPPTDKDQARHLIEGEKPFEWWYFDGHLDNGEVFVGVFQAPSFTTGTLRRCFPFIRMIGAVSATDSPEL